MAKKQDLEIGQRVRFRRSHDRNVEMTGKIVKVHEDADCVDVVTEPDGKISEVETTETAHVDDVTPIAEMRAISEEPGEESSASDETGAESHRGRRRR